MPAIWKKIITHLCLISEQFGSRLGLARLIGNLPGTLTQPALPTCVTGLRGQGRQSPFCARCVWDNRNLGGEFSFCCLKISIYLGRLYQACCWAACKWKLPHSVWRKGWRIWLGKGHESALILGCWELPSLPPPTMVKTFFPPPHSPPLHTKSSLLQTLEKSQC